MKYALQQELFRKVNVIPSKINNNTISKGYMIFMNDIDGSTTIGAIKVEKSLKTIQSSHIWYPILASAILHEQLWNCVRTKLKKLNQPSRNIKHNI